MLIKKKTSQYTSKRFSRRGIRISPRAHNARIVLYMILIPVMTWYGHQKYTNPFKYHPNTTLSEYDGSTLLSFYRTTTRDTIDRFHFVLDEDDVENHQTNDSLNTYIVLTDSGFEVDSASLTSISFPNLYGHFSKSHYTITYFDSKIVIPLRETIWGTVSEKSDILLVDIEKTNHYSIWRQASAPRVSLLLNGDALSDLPENVVQWASGDRFEIVESRKSRLIVKDMDDCIDE